MLRYHINRHYKQHRWIINRGGHHTYIQYTHKRINSKLHLEICPDETVQSASKYKASMSGVKLFQFLGEFNVDGVGLC